jgi:hypothetical protein
MKMFGRRSVWNWTAAVLSVAGLSFGDMRAASAADVAEPVPSLPSVITFSVTEIQFQLGKLDNPFNRTKSWTPIITLQHASSWVFGDVFFFIDFLDDRDNDPTNFNDKEAYGEFYAYFSSAKLLGIKYDNGIIKDVGVVAGVNAGADSNFQAYLPGGYIDWNVPGFVLFRTQLTAVIDDSDTPSRQKDGWQFDWSFVRPFEIGGQFFSVEGHIEYTGNSRTKDFGGAKQRDWILAQPQFRWDAGYAFTGKKDVFFLGTEYQYWRNVLGAKTDESAFQALAVVRF